MYRNHTVGGNDSKVRKVPKRHTAASYPDEPDLMDAYETTRLFAMLALLAGGGAVVIGLLSITPAGRTFARSALTPIAFPLAFVVAAVTMAGSLTLSESFGFRPCTLCWYQRIAAYPLALLLFVALVTRAGRSVRRYVLPLTVIGAAISSWHLLVERFPSLESNSCDPDNPCSAILVEHFGFVTIPAMALACFASVFALSAYFPKERR